MPLTKVFNFRLTYRLTNQFGNGVNNTVPFSTRANMVNYAKRLHKSNPLSWNVVSFEQKVENNWIRDDVAHSDYMSKVNSGIKTTHIAIAPTLLRLSELSRSLEKVAVKRELNDTEKNQLLSIMSELSATLIPVEMINSIGNMLPDFNGHILPAENQNSQESVPESLAIANSIASQFSPDFEKETSPTDEKEQELPRRKEKGFFGSKRA